MKRIFKWLSRITLVLLLLTAILWLTSKIAEQKIISQALQAINENIEVPVYINDIHFSLLKKFPQATLQLKDVTLLSAKNFSNNGFQSHNSDTLLWIENMYLSLDMMALIQHRIELSKIAINNGFINLLVDSKGRSNYSILKSFTRENKKDSVDNSFQFMLNQISLSQLDIHYQNLYKNTRVNWYFPDYSLRGAFFKSNYDVATKGKVLLKSFQFQQTTISPESPAELAMNLHFANNQLELNQSILNLNGQKISAEGTIKLEPNLNLNLRFEGQQIQLSKWQKLVKTSAQPAFELDGLFAFKGLVTGDLNEMANPKIQVNFAWAEGSFKTSSFQIKHGFNLKGSFTNGTSQKSQTSGLTISEFNWQQNNSTLGAKLNVTNFVHPYIKLQTNIKLDFNDLSQMLPELKKQNLEGTLTGNYSTRGEISWDTAIWKQSLANTAHQANLDLQNFVWQNSKLNLSLKQANLRLNKQSLQLNDANGSVQGTLFSGNITLLDMVDALLLNSRPLKINASLTADAINYEDFAPLFQTDSKDTTDTDDLKILLNGTIKAGSFTYENIIASQVETHLLYKDTQIQFDLLKFKAFEGNADITAVYLFNDPNKSTLWIDGNLKQVNIKQLFTTFNNFDQKILTDKHLEGKLSTNFSFEGSFIDQKFHSETIDFLGHVRIDNGKLINFDPITEVSKFAEIEELKNISFSTLENDLLISQNQVHIPKMEISSNAFDMSIAGQQNFNGDYSYHLQIFLSDFLKGKSKHLQKQQSEFGTIEDDGYGRTRLFLLAESKNGKSSVGLDKEAIGQNLKQGLKDQKRELKKIFHDEFGWFKKDTTLKKETPKTNKPAFQIEWDEE